MAARAEAVAAVVEGAAVARGSEDGGAAGVTAAAADARTSRRKCGAGRMESRVDGLLFESMPKDGGEPRDPDRKGLKLRIRILSALLFIRCVAGVALSAGLLNEDSPITVGQSGTLAEMGLVVLVFVDGQGAISLLLFGIQVRRAAAVDLPIICPTPCPRPAPYRLDATPRSAFRCPQPEMMRALARRWDGISLPLLRSPWVRALCCMPQDADGMESSLEVGMLINSYGASMGQLGGASPHGHRAGADGCDEERENGVPPRRRRRASWFHT